MLHAVFTSRRSTYVNRREVADIVLSLQILWQGQVEALAGSSTQRPPPRHIGPKPGTNPKQPKTQARHRPKQPKSGKTGPKFKVTFRVLCGTGRNTPHQKTVFWIRPTVFWINPAVFRAFRAFSPNAPHQKKKLDKPGRFVDKPGRFSTVPCCFAGTPPT